MTDTPKIDFEAFDAAKYFPSLDGIRAICVLLVMFNHVHARVPPWIIGWLGVDVFFVLSGFLITTLLIRERDQYGYVSKKAFYIRRFFRIVPVYFFTILLYAASVRIMHDAARTVQFNLALPWLLTFMQEYAPAAGAGRGLGHAWTLAIEEKYYLLWPFVLMTLYPFHVRAIFLLAIIFIAVMFCPPVFSRSYGGLLIGSGLAIALCRRERWYLIWPLLRLSDTYVCACVVGAYILSGISVRLVLLFSLSIAWLIASLVLRTGMVRRVLESSILVFIGKRSYAIYLIHVLVLNYVARISERYLPPNAFYIVMLTYLTCIVLASLIYMSIEIPCIRLGKALSERFVGSSYNRKQFMFPVE